MAERIGRAVLELTTDGGSFFKGVEEARGKLRGLGATVKDLQRENVRLAQSFSGRSIISEATKVTNVIGAMGGASRLTRSEQARVNAIVSEAVEKYRVLGRTAPKSLLDIQRATQGAAGSTSVLASGFGTLTAAFTAGNVLSRGVSVIANLGREAIASAGALVDMSNKTGLSTETLQRMGFVAGQTGATLEDFTNSSFKLGVNLASGSDTVRGAVKDLGLSLEVLRRLSPDEQFLRIVAALHKVEDAQERNRLGSILFGKQFAQIAAAVASDYDKIAQAAKVSGDAQVRAIDDAADAWDSFVKDTGTGIQTVLGNAVLATRALSQARERLADQGNNFPSVAEVHREALFILQNGLLKARGQDIELSKAGAAAQASYVSQLAKVRAELARLTPAQLAEIDAAHKLGTSTDDLETKYGLTEGALRLLNESTKTYASSVRELSGLHDRAFGLDKVAAADQLVKAIGGLAGVTNMDVDALKDFNKLMTEAINAAKRNGKEIPLEWLRIEEATRSNVGTLADYVEMLHRAGREVKNIEPPPLEPIPFVSELDQERTRKLLELNPPGAPLRKAAEKTGESLGKDIREGLGRDLEQIPHFITQSVLHTGSFKNGLKAIGVDIADTIVEALIKEFIRKMIAARLVNAIRNALSFGAGPAAASAPGWLRPFIPGIGNQPTPPNPVTSPPPRTPGDPIPPGGGIVPLPPAPVPPPGGPGRGGTKPGPAAVQLSAVRSFASGGFVRPYVTQRAVLHGGSHGELAAPVTTIASMLSASLAKAAPPRFVMPTRFVMPPLQMPMLAPAGHTSALMPTAPVTREAAAPPVVVHQTLRLEVHTIDAENFDRHFDRKILPRLKQELRFNSNGLVTQIRKRTKG